jgi:calcineurin-like phosphoesterase family protein
MKINTKTNTVWVTSDTHYSHLNICSATTKWTNPSRVRIFDSLDHMNDTIVDNLNTHVREDDILFHLGDWSFGGFSNIETFRNRIHCKTIHLILGNHDHHILKNKNNCRDLFTSVSKYMEVTFDIIHGNIPVVMMHYPISSWNTLSNGGLHFHGHVHLPPDRIQSSGRRIDVGVDGNQYMPHNVNELISMLLKIPISSDVKDDHHS